MSEKHDENGLLPAAGNGSLSTGALKTGLRVAAKEVLAPEELAVARREKPYLRELSDESVRLVLREPPMWEYRLYFQALGDRVAWEAAEALRDVPKPVAMEPMAMTTWMSDKLDEYLRLGERINQLINAELQDALGPPGQPGDAAAIVSLAKKIGRVYRRFLDIRMEARAVQVEPWLRDLSQAFAAMCDQCIKEFETYPQNSLNILMDALADADGEAEVVLRFEMKFSPDTGPFNKALSSAQRRIRGS
jgi:hypothetical protein